LLEFTRIGSSGRSFQLPGGLCLVREFDTFVLRGEPVGRDEQALAIPDPGPGSGGAVIGGRRYDVVWGGAVPPGASFEESFSSLALRFPLRLRGWAPGDRIALGYGSKKLKKLFSEARVARGEREGDPVLIDSVGRVLWVAGLARSILALPEPEQNSMTLGLSYVRDD
jgi:tRNA(Ile)-lysidine synthase